MSDQRFKNVVAVVIAFLTVITALLAYLQSDASARDDRANRDTKRYTLEALGRKVSGDSRVNFDYNVAYQSWFELNLLSESASYRGDDAAARRYEILRDQVLQLSPLLQDPYRDQASGDVDINRYEVEVYVREVVVLTENYLAASKVKDAWDKKSNTYILHLTLLAVSLFLFGLSTTIAGKFTRWVFSGMGMAFALVGVGWAALTWAEPVPDLREAGKAIPNYAEGVGWAYREQWQEAVSAYDRSIQDAPDYINAYTGRAEAYEGLGQVDRAIQDYEKARALGDRSVNTAGMLAWHYYSMGRFEEAAEMNRIALRSSPDELWVQYDLGLSLLAAGKMEDALRAYQQGMDIAARQVSEASAAGQAPPSYLWWGLDDAAISLQVLLDELDQDSKTPITEKISNPEAVSRVAAEMLAQVKSLSVALEYTGKAPQGSLKAAVSEFVFYQPLYDEDGNEIDPLVDSAFPEGVNEVRVQFDYEGVEPGQELVAKIYIDDVEEPSWRIVETLQEGSGTLEIPISVAYTESFILASGMYQVDLYIDGHLAQTGWFVVTE